MCHTVSLGKKRGSLSRYFFEYAAFFLWTLVRVHRCRCGGGDMRSSMLIPYPTFWSLPPVLAKWMGAKLILDMHEITPEFYMSKYGIAGDSG